MTIRAGERRLLGQMKRSTRTSCSTIAAHNWQRPRPSLDGWFQGVRGRMRFRYHHSSSVRHLCSAMVARDVASSRIPRSKLTSLTSLSTGSCSCRREVASTPRAPLRCGSEKGTEYLCHHAPLLSVLSPCTIWRKTAASAKSPRAPSAFRHSHPRHRKSLRGTIQLLKNAAAKKDVRGDGTET